MKGTRVNRQPISLEELAQMVAGQWIGDARQLISGAAPMYEVAAGQITLLDDARQFDSLVGRAAAIVVAKPIENCPLNQLVCEHVRDAFTKIVGYFVDADDAVADRSSGIAPTAHVYSSAQIGADPSIEHGVTIGRRVVIGDRVRLMPGVVVMDDAMIGDDCVVFPNVTLYERTRVGNRVTIHSGSVLGAYGFGYKSCREGHERTAQLGYVHIEDDVEIGACVTIDRGTYGSTRIGHGTKIDNQVMIGHNCQIGPHNMLCAQVGIAGSCQTGAFVVLAGQVGIKDHVVLGDHAVVGAQAGVMDNLEGGKVYLGSPATTQREQMQIMAVQRRLPEMRRSLKMLERAIQASHDAVAKTPVEPSLRSGRAA